MAKQPVVTEYTIINQADFVMPEAGVIIRETVLEWLFPQETEAPLWGNGRKILLQE